MTGIFQVEILSALCDHISNTRGDDNGLLGAFACCLIARAQIIGPWAAELFRQPITRSELVPSGIDDDDGSIFVQHRNVGAQGVQCFLKELASNALLWVAVLHNSHPFSQQSEHLFSAKR